MSITLSGPKLEMGLKAIETDRAVKTMSGALVIFSFRSFFFKSQVIIYLNDSMF